MSSKLRKAEALVESAGATPEEAATARLTAGRIRIAIRSVAFQISRLEGKGKGGKLPPGDVLQEKAAILEQSKFQHVLPACETEPDFLVLPITPVTAKRYMAAVVLWLAESDALSKIIEGSVSFTDVVTHLSSGFYFPMRVRRAGGKGWDTREIKLRVPIPVASDLVRLNLKATEGAPWEVLRVQHVEKRENRVSDSDEAVKDTIDFGVYSLCLGRIGSAASLISTFGEARHTALSPIISMGAESLSDLILRWEQSRRLPRAPTRDDQEKEVRLRESGITDPRGQAIAAAQIEYDLRRERIKHELDIEKEAQVRLTRAKATLKQEVEELKQARAQEILSQNPGLPAEELQLRLRNMPELDFKTRWVELERRLSWEFERQQDKSQRGVWGASRPQPHLATFFNTQYTLATNGAPTVLVVTGSSASATGYSLLPAEPGRMLWEDLAPIAEATALLTVGPKAVVGVVLPPPVLQGTGRGSQEITRVFDYERALVGVAERGGVVQSPASDFAWYIQQLLTSAGPGRSAALSSSLPRLANGDSITLCRFPVDDKDYFGVDSPVVQEWPGFYAKSVLHLLSRGVAREAIVERIREAGLTLPSVRESSEVAEGQSFLKLYANLIRGFDTILEELPKRKPSLGLKDLPWVQKVTATFVEIVGTGLAYDGLFVPLSIEIQAADSEGGEVQAWPVTDRGAQMLNAIQANLTAYLSGEVEFKGRVLPVITAEAFLINTSDAVKNFSDLDIEGEGRPLRVTKTDVRRLLRQQALPISPTPLGKGEEAPWYLGIGAARIRPIRGGEITDGYWSGYTAGKNEIPVVLRHLLRTDLKFRGGRPYLTFVAPGPSAPWDSPEVRYLLTNLPVFSPETGSVVPASPLMGQSGAKAYKKEFLRSLQGAGPSETVVGGQAAVLAGRELAGTSAKRVSRAFREQGEGGDGGPRGPRLYRAERGRAPVSGPYAPTGFYTLIRRVLSEAKTEAKSEQEVPSESGEAALGAARGKAKAGKKWEAPRLTPDKFDSLHTLLQESWGFVLPLLNETREFYGQPLLPATTQAPVPDAPGYTPELEQEALDILQKLLVAQRPEGLIALLPSQRILHPLPTMAKSGAQGVEFSPIFEELDPETQDTILAVENPRRRARKAKAQRNPLSQETLAKIQAAIEAGAPLGDVANEELRTPTDIEALAEAVRRFYPKKGPRAQFALPQVLATLGQNDLFGRYAPAAADPEVEEAFRQRFGRPDGLKTSLDASQAAALRQAAALDLQTGLTIAQGRQRAAREQRVGSAAGVYCKNLRNTSRLPWEDVPSPLKASNTVWIVVAPPVGEQTVQRIMTFRNGTHIDCDRLVTPREHLGQTIGKYLQATTLWIAENPKRADRLRFIALAHVGSPVYRLLWTSGEALTPETFARHWTEDSPGTDQKLVHGAKEYAKLQARVRVRGKASVSYPLPVTPSEVPSSGETSLSVRPAPLPIEDEEEEF